MQLVADLPHVVLDTNILVSGLTFTNSAPQRVLRLLEEGAYQLVVSKEVMEEWEEVLTRKEWARYGLGRSLALDYLAYLKRKAVELHVIQPQTLQVRDPQDQCILDCALTAQANFLVTGDNDLLVLDSQTRRFSLRIVSARDFIGLLIEGCGR